MSDLVCNVLLPAPLPFPCIRLSAMTESMVYRSDSMAYEPPFVAGSVEYEPEKKGKLTRLADGVTDYMETSGISVGIRVRQLLNSPEFLFYIFALSITLISAVLWIGSVFANDCWSSAANSNTCVTIPITTDFATQFDDGNTIVRQYSIYHLFRVEWYWGAWSIGYISLVVGGFVWIMVMYYLRRDVVYGVYTSATGKTVEARAIENVTEFYMYHQLDTNHFDPLKHIFMFVPATAIHIWIWFYFYTGFYWAIDCLVALAIIVMIRVLQFYAEFDNRSSAVNVADMTTLQFRDAKGAIVETVTIRKRHWNWFVPWLLLAAFFVTFESVYVWKYPGASRQVYMVISFFLIWAFEVFNLLCSILHYATDNDTAFRHWMRAALTIAFWPFSWLRDPTREKAGKLSETPVNTGVVLIALAAVAQTIYWMAWGIAPNYTTFPPLSLN